MSIKYSPLANFPYSSSYAITASIAELNIGTLLNNQTASFVETAQFSLTLGEQGPPGKDLVIIGTLIEL
jgi:hypothetical protein